MVTMAVENRGNSSPERRSIPVAIKRRIVELFATFHAPSSIRDIIFDEFDYDLSDRSINDFDPSKRYAKVGTHLRKLFEEVRAEYVANTGSVAVAHQAHRLRLISQVVEKATTSKDYNAALKGLELAAKEMGGALTNERRQEVFGKVEHRLSVEDARAELATRLGALIEGGTLGNALPSPSPSPTQGGHAAVQDGEYTEVPET